MSAQYAETYTRQFPRASSPYATAVPAAPSEREPQGMLILVVDQDQVKGFFSSLNTFAAGSR
jgi:hypothetical protein